MTSHLGAAMSALLDGELDHAHREQVLAHLAHCLPCRAEVEAQRRFKAALRVVDGPPPAVALTDRLLAITRTPFDSPASVAQSTLLAARPMAGWSWPAAALRRPARPVRRASRRRSARIRRSAVGGAIVALSLGGALALGGPPPRGPVAPVDPTSASFVFDYVSTSPEVPFTEADTLPASLRTTP